MTEPTAASSRLSHPLTDPGEAARRVTVARLVADHWRHWAMNNPTSDALMPVRVTAHPLCCVLAALDGVTDPDQLGIERGSITAALIRDERPDRLSRYCKENAPAAGSDVCVVCHDAT